jgi:hypothetical protein
MARPLEGVRRGLAAAGWRALIQGKGSKDKPRLFWSFLRLGTVPCINIC